MTINIDTLGKASRHRMVLHITCRHCGHKGQLKARELARAYGFGTDPRTLTFRCSRCDMRNCIVRVMEEMRR